MIILDDKEKTPAWLICDDILTKCKDEIILEAIDILHEEIKAKRIDMQGYVPMLIDKPEEVERDMFLINNLLSRAHEIRENYKDYMKKESEIKDPEPALVARDEELRKFMLALDSIIFLMSLSKVFESWAADVGVFSNIKDPVEVFSKTLHHNNERIEALKFILGSSTFWKSEPLHEDERKMLEQASQK